MTLTHAACGFKVGGGRSRVSPWLLQPRSWHMWGVAALLELGCSEWHLRGVAALLALVGAGFSYALLGADPTIFLVSTAIAVGEVNSLFHLLL